MIELGYILISTIIITLIAFIGIFTLSLNENILIKPDPLEEKTKSGIYLGQPEEQNKAEVIHAGDSILNKGDKVLYSKFSGQEIYMDEQKYIIISLFIDYISIRFNIIILNKLFKPSNNFR